MNSVADGALFFGTLSLAAFLVDWLARRTPARHLGSALLALIIGALFANLGVLPSPGTEKGTYTGLLAYIAPLSIFYLILQVDLRDLRAAGTPMLMTFALAAASVALGGWLGFALFLDGSALDAPGAVVGGTLVAGHIGGSANFNAVAIHYDLISTTTVFVTVLAVDHLFIALWIGLTVLLPRLDCRVGADLPGRAAAGTSRAAPSATTPPLTPGGIALYVTAGFLALWASHRLSTALGPLGVQPPVVLLVTLFGLAVAHAPGFRKTAGYNAFGDYLVTLFLLCIGAFTDPGALVQRPEIAAQVAGVIGVMLTVHAAATFSLGRWLGLEWAVLAVGSQASIGGPVSAAAVAEAVDRPDLVLPAVLVGAVGGALGTFAGFGFVAFFT